MRVSEDLAKFHQAASTHHRSMSKLHGDAMGKAVDGNPEHQFHKGAAAAHSAAADSHDEMCQACHKATADSLNKMVPTQVSAVTPTPPGVRAVPRFGQREVPEKANVDPQFAKLVAVDEDDPNMTDLHL
jgi:hypothetical protein